MLASGPVEPNEIGFLKHSFDEFAEDLLEGKPAHHQIAFWQHACDEARKRGAI